MSEKISQPQTEGHTSPPPPSYESPPPPQWAGQQPNNPTVSQEGDPHAPGPVYDLPDELIQVVERPENAVVNQPPPLEKPMDVLHVPEPVMVTPLERLTEIPTLIDCPHCRRRAKTTVEKEGSSMQTMAAILCCLICVCTVCLPALCHWFEDTHISCSACRRKVATIPHDGPIQVFRPAAVEPREPSEFPDATAPSQKVQYK